MSTSDSDDRPTLLILYATETGNAQDAADYIARQCRRVDVPCRVANVASYALVRYFAPTAVEELKNFAQPDLLSEDLVIFVVSTTGSGVEPRSMTPLWTTLLRSDIPPDTFEDFPFCVFGLGDSSYEKFCWAAKKLSRRLVSLGGVEFYERGEADDQHQLGVDGALYPWTEGLLNKLPEILGTSPRSEPGSPDVAPPPRASVRPISEVNPPSSASCLDEILKADSSYHTARVSTNKRITAEGWNQDVRHLELVFDDDIEHNPGDVAVIHQIASSTDVDAFLETVNWLETADEPLSINTSNQTLPDHLPPVATLRTLFTRYLDFNAVPRRSFFQYLRYFTTSDLEKERLDEFLSLEGADELYEYCHRVRRTIAEVLTEFRNVQIPKDYIFDVFPTLRLREFSIASSIKTHPRELQLCIAIVKYRTKLKVPRKGVCTAYISALQPGDELQVGLKKGLLRLPADNATPVICVGPGTGIAPMRAVLEERIADGSTANFLYFGCRSATKDHHYGQEWERYVQEQKLVYRVAFSRDGPEGVKRTYVQDLLKEDAKIVWDVVGDRKGWVLISGSSNKMPAGVREAIAFAAQDQGGLSEAEATSFVQDMVKEGRLIEECWS